MDEYTSHWWWKFNDGHSFLNNTYLPGEIWEDPPTAFLINPANPR